MESLIWDEGLWGEADWGLSPTQDLSRYFKRRGNDPCASPGTYVRVTYVNPWIDRERCVTVRVGTSREGEVGWIGGQETNGSQNQGQTRLNGTSSASASRGKVPSGPVLTSSITESTPGLCRGRMFGIQDTTRLIVQ